MKYAYAYEIADAMKYAAAYVDLFYFIFCDSKIFHNPKDYFILRSNISFRSLFKNLILNFIQFSQCIALFYDL